MSGRKIIEGLRQAVAGQFGRVTIDGETWERRRHRHDWKFFISNAITKDGIGKYELRTYHCYQCGGIRYDKVGAEGLISSTITDDLGKVVASGGEFK
jgi:hypothetical protein